MRSDVVAGHGPGGAARPVAARRAHPRRLPGREEPAALTWLSGPTARSIVTWLLPNTSFPFDAARRIVGTPSVPTPPAGHGAQGESKAPRACLRGGSGATWQKIGGGRFSSMASTCPLRRLARRGTSRRCGGGVGGVFRFWRCGAPVLATPVPEAPGCAGTGR